MTDVDAATYKKQVVETNQRLQETQETVQTVLLNRAAMEDRIVNLEKERDDLKKQMLTIESDVTNKIMFMLERKGIQIREQPYPIITPH